MASSADQNKDALLDIQHKVECHLLAQIYTIFMFLCGILGNSLNLLVMTRRQIKSPVYIYLRALAISDFLVILFIIPKFIIICHIHEECQTVMIMRIFLTSIINTFIGCSNLTTLGVTIERFLAVCFPFEWKVHGLKTAKVAVLFIVIAWIISFLFYVPNMFVMYYKQNSTSGKCLEDVNLSNDTGYRAYKWTRESLFRIAPIVLMIMINAYMLFSVRRNFRNSITAFNITNHRPKKVQADKKLTILVALLAVMYIICILPEALVFIINDYLIVSSPKLFYYLASFMNLTEMFNYSMTFFIYLCFHREFRQALYNLKAYNETRKVSVASDYGNRSIASQRESIQSSVLSSTNTSSISF